MTFSSNPSQAKQTVYNGDVINGVPVITCLNEADLEPGKIHRFMFKGADMNIGQSWYVPLMVAKGSNPGKRILINTGIHGDELNGSRTLQQVFIGLDPTELSGTVIGVIQACPNSLMHVSRSWYSTTDSGEYEDMNRVFPGQKNGNTARAHAYKLWHDLWYGNAEYALDLHTQSTDTSYPLFIYADYRIPAVQRMAELIPADQIKIDEGEEGSVETTFNRNGIAALTLEIGQGRCYQPELIERAVEGISNILVDLNIKNGQLRRTALTFGSYIGKNMTTIRAEVGGYANILATIGDNIEAGQKVAEQLNPFGDVIKEYAAPISGKVLSIATGATREPGALLVRILA